MAETITINGKEYKVFTVATALGTEYKVICTRETYRNDGSLAIRVWDIDENGKLEPFGTLTVNLTHRLQNETRAFVKNYSENASWAESLCKQLGAKNTGIACNTGYVTLHLYDFTGVELNEIA